MSNGDEKRVLAAFQKEVQDHVDVIKDFLNKGDRKSALALLGDLEEMRAEQDRYSNQILVVKGKISEGDRPVVDVRGIAMKKLAIVTAAIEEVKHLF